MVQGADSSTTESKLKHDAKLQVAEGSEMAKSVVTDVLAVADQASGMLVGGAAGLLSGFFKGLGDGFDAGRVKGGLIGGIIGIPVAAISHGLQGLSSGMNTGVSRGVRSIITPPGA